MLLPYLVQHQCQQNRPQMTKCNDKLQGSVATYLRCGGVVDNQIEKGLLLSVWVKNVYLAKLQEKQRGCLMHFTCLANTLLKDEESAWDNHDIVLSAAEAAAVQGYGTSTAPFIISVRMIWVTLSRRLTSRLRTRQTHRGIASTASDDRYSAAHQTYTLSISSF